MRILIADDSSSLPASVQDLFGRAPAGASADKTPSVESVVIALSGGAAAAAAAAPAKSMGRDTGSDGCPPPEPLPPCPPCSLHDQPELLATILDAIGMALLNRGCIEAGSKFVIAALRHPPRALRQEIIPTRLRATTATRACCAFATS